MTEQFLFQLDNRLMYGAGRSRELAAFLRERGFGRVLVAVDAGVARHSSYYREILEIVAPAAQTTVTTLRDTEEPDYDYLDEVAARLRQLQRPDLLIAIGGGSCLDMGKALAVLLSNPGKGIDYRGFDQVRVPGVPTLLIPTTAGTGSEVTINAVFTDKREMRKLGINGRYLSATWALLDAEWTLSCPSAAAVSAGMDAMVHTLESFMCRQHNALTRVFSREAFRLLYRDLPCLLEEPGNIERRQNLLLGAYLAGAALFNSGSGIAGAFSYPLGVNYKIPHGICGAVFVASVVEYNAARAMATTPSCSRLSSRAQRCRRKRRHGASPSCCARCATGWKCRGRSSVGGSGSRTRRTSNAPCCPCRLRSTRTRSPSRRSATPQSCCAGIWPEPARGRRAATGRHAGGCRNELSFAHMEYPHAGL